jgi:hypothetical protein
MYYKVTLRRVSCNCFYSGRVITISYSEYVFVALDMPQEMRMRHIVIYGLSGSTIFFSHYLINSTILDKKLLHIKCVFLFSLQFFMKRSSFYEELSEI